MGHSEYAVPDQIQGSFHEVRNGFRSGGMEASEIVVQNL